MNFHVLRMFAGSAAETEYDPIAPRLGEAPRCPLCDGFTGQLPWLPPYRTNLRAFGERIGDVVFWPYDSLLFSSAFLRAWRAAGLKGVSDACPVQVEAIRPRHLARRLPEFWHVRPQREDARIDPLTTRLIPPRLAGCEMCGADGVTNAILGLGIAQESWRGADLFVPWGLDGITIVTDRVVALASASGFANVTTIPSDEYRWDPLRLEGPPMRPDRTPPTPPGSPPS